MIDWTTIIVAVIGMVTVEAVFKAIDRVRFKLQDRELKKNEVKSSSADVQSKDIENDNAQIDLGTKFMEQSLAMTQKVQDIMMETNKLRNEQWEQQKTSMEELITRMGGVETKLDSLSDRVTAIEEWGNGDLSAFREAHRHAY